MHDPLIEKLWFAVVTDGGVQTVGQARDVVVEFALTMSEDAQAVLRGHQLTGAALGFLDEVVVGLEARDPQRAFVREFVAFYLSAVGGHPDFGVFDQMPEVEQSKVVCELAVGLCRSLILYADQVARPMPEYPRLLGWVTTMIYEGLLPPGPPAPAPGRQAPGMRVV